MNAAANEQQKFFFYVCMSSLTAVWIEIPCKTDVQKIFVCGWVHNNENDINRLIIITEREKIKGGSNISYIFSAIKNLLLLYNQHWNLGMVCHAM